MYKEFFWDLDGTLYNTYPQMVTAFLQTLHEVDVEMRQQAIYEIMRQQSLGAAFDHVEQQFGVARTKLEKIYYPLEHTLQHPQLFAGVKEVLEKVVAVGGHNFLLTHRDDSSLTFMKNDGITSLFKDFVTAAQPFPRKPDRTSLNYLIERNQVNRHEAVMIGDRNLDVDAGHNAQIAGILFDPDHLITATSQPEQTIRTMTSLLNFITSK
ncbi:HAD-IA family hydrolase [Paucilactobacillus sp. N302-9]